MGSDMPLVLANLATMREAVATIEEAPDMVSAVRSTAATDASTDHTAPAAAEAAAA
jgi:hypothetical protein